MKINSAMLYVISRIENLDYYDAKDWMNAHFHQIGSGCESIVFTRDGFDYVIKIQYSSFTWSGVKSENPSTKHFMEMEVVKCNHFNIIIQPKVVALDDLKRFPHDAYERFKDFIFRKFPKVTDIHSGNVGILNGRLVVIDWNINPDC